jgi:hypothetical protein
MLNEKLLVKDEKQELTKSYKIAPTTYEAEEKRAADLGLKAGTYVRKLIEADLKENGYL